MKRLLAYLLIVLGLGLAVNGSAYAKTYYCENKQIDNLLPAGFWDFYEMLEKNNDDPLTVAKQFYKKVFNKKDLFNCRNKKKDRFRLVSEDEYYKGEKKLLIQLRTLVLQDKGIYFRRSGNGYGTFTLPDGSKYVGEIKDGDLYGQGTLTSTNGSIVNGIWNKSELVERNNIKTKIAKAEPSQTQTAYNETNNNQRIDLIFCKEFETQFIFEVFIKKSHQQCPNSYPIEVDYKEYKQKINNIVLCFNNIRGQPNILKTMKWRRCEGEYSGGQFPGKYTTLKAKFDGKNIFIFKKELPGELDISLKKTQIAKAEPSQTQELAQKPDFQNPYIGEIIYLNNPDIPVTSNFYVNDQGEVWGNYSYKFKNKNYKGNFYEGKLIDNNLKISWSDSFGKGWLNITLNENYDVFDGEWGFIKNNKKIAKEGNWTGNKQNIKLVQEPKEEFKPEDKDIDKDPPIIQIAEAITVDSQAYTLKGKVKDKSQIYLTIDGRQVQVKKGKFKVDRFNIDPGEVEEIKIVAIDKWNNKTEKTIKVTIDLKSIELARSFEDLKPNSVRVKTDKNKIAIIIGVEKYKNMTVCNYCNRDAKAFKAYASRALGVVPSNIISLVDSKATRGEILRAFKISLPKIAGDGGKEINIFFAGHGLASENGEDLYIIPQDGDQGLLEDTAVSRIELIKLIKKVNPKSVTMFFDTCYSGQTRGEQMLVASLRGIRIVDADNIPDNFTIFTASSSNQGSSHIEEAKHGMFSYYLMKGLEGKADTNRDKKITNGELIAYLKTNVSKEAFTQNREQDPMLSGDPNKVLMSYR